MDTYMLTPLWLQPLAGDWRQRVKAAHKRERASEPAAAAAAKPTRAAAAAAASPGGAAPDLAALSAGLPPGWKAVLDKASGDVYYGNPVTKVGETGPAPRNHARRASGEALQWLQGKPFCSLAACDAPYVPRQCVR